MVQFSAAAFTALYSFCTTYVILKSISATMDVIPALEEHMALESEGRGDTAYVLVQDQLAGLPGSHKQLQELAEYNTAASTVSGGAPTTLPRDVSWSSSHYGEGPTATDAPSSLREAAMKRACRRQLQS